jgi:RNA polymerase sigma factor (sigma-70 family)
MKVLLRTQSDARLVALARAGHDRAFEAIVERYRRPLLRACRRILPEARAEDALQLALMAAWTALRRGDEVSDLRPWLYKVVRNTALNQLRVAGYDFDELVDTLAAADDPGDEIERRALVRQTLTAVAALPERQRDALLRTAIEGRGQDEVARDLGLTDTALRQLVHRARVSVRAAATAVVPLPLAAWLAAATPRAEPLAGRIAEIVAGSSAGATLAKAGTVVVLTGGAVSAPAVVDEHPQAARERPAARAHVERAPAAAVAAPARARPRPTAEPPQPVPAPPETRRDSGREEARHEQNGDDRDERQHETRGDDDGERTLVRRDEDDRNDSSGGDDDLSGDDEHDDLVRRDEEDHGERRAADELEDAPEGDEEEPPEHDEPSGVDESEDDR